MSYGKMQHRPNKISTRYPQHFTNNFFFLHLYTSNINFSPFFLKFLNVLYINQLSHSLTQNNLQVWKRCTPQTRPTWRLFRCVRPTDQSNYGLITILILLDLLSVIRSVGIEGIHVCSMHTLHWCASRLSAWRASNLPLNTVKQFLHLFHVTMLMTLNSDHHVWVHHIPEVKSQQHPAAVCSGEASPREHLGTSVWKKKHSTLL